MRAISRRGSYGAASGGNRGYPRSGTFYFKPGAWNARCWTCSKLCKSDEMLKLDIWTGNGYVCDSCYETVNPQQFVRGIPDKQSVPWVQNPPPLMIEQGNGQTEGDQVRRGKYMTGAPFTGGQPTG